MNTFSKKILTLVAILLLPIILWMFFLFSNKPNKTSIPQKEVFTNTPEIQKEDIQPKKENSPQQETKSISPIARAQERITKKPFGVLINPKTSPVQPEKFSGFHTGTDFEIFPEELNEKVEVFAICEGEVIQKKYVNGYGGVIIQSCTFQNKPVTALYGHLDLEKSSAEVGDELKKDQLVAVLADDKSYYSAGERKHLHLGIHKGNAADLRGYVQTKNQLENWLDFEKINSEIF